MLSPNEKADNIHLISYGYITTDVDTLNNDLITEFSE
jgi:hypothetical protein